MLDKLDELFKKNKVLATYTLLIYAEKNHMSDKEVSDILDKYMSPEVRANVLKIVMTMSSISDPEIDNIIKQIMEEQTKE